MIKKRLLVGILFALAFAFAGVSTVSADECNHNWVDEDSYDNCTCSYCGATKPHNLVVAERNYGSCEEEQTITYQCLDCGALILYETGTLGTHHWSKPQWIEMDDEVNRYGQECTVCWAYHKVPLTVKKGKTKRVIPKSALKNVKKKKVSYNKNKIKVTKDGKVKGKKLGTTTVKWKFKYKVNGYSWWETYKVDIKVQ